MSAKDKKVSKKANLKIAILAVVILFVALYLFIYVIPKVSDKFIDTYTAEYGTLEIGENVDFLVVRTERVYTADSAGKLTRVASKGSLMRRNSRIINLGGVGYYSQERGIVSYCFDGLEASLTPENMVGMKEKFLLQFVGDEKNEEIIKKYKVQETAKGNVKSGDEIFKIVDNSEWFIISWIDTKDKDNFKKGNSVYIRFIEDGEESESLKTKVYAVEEEGEKTQLILSCNRQWDDFDAMRYGTCKIISTSKNGIILEKDSLVTEEGKLGVYTVNKYGNSKFVRVKVLAEDEEYVVVEKNYFFDDDGKQITTVNNYAKILRPNVAKKNKDNEEEIEEQE